MLFYEVINHSISVAKDLTFVSFIKASVRAQTELEQQTQSAELSKKIESEPLEVREFVSAFASTMMGIMMANSLLLIVLVKIGYRCYAVLKRIVRPNMFPKQRRKIQAYHYFKRLHEVEYGSTIHLNTKHQNILCFNEVLLIWGIQLLSSSFIDPAKGALNPFRLLRNLIRLGSRII